MPPFAQPGNHVLCTTARHKVGHFLIGTLSIVLLLIASIHDAAAVGPFVPVTGASNPFNGTDVGSDSAPVFVDIDRDGDLDAFIGAADGTLRYYKNTGTATAPVFALQSNDDTPPFFSGASRVLDFGSNSHPAFVDADNDGDPDAFIGLSDGTTRFFDNLSETGNGVVFGEITSNLNPWYGLTMPGGFSAPTFVDIDPTANPDGDLDAFIGVGGTDGQGAIYFYENAGADFSLTGFSISGAGGAFALRAVPAFANVDSQPDKELFVGSAAGNIRYFLNFDTYPPNFFEGTGLANPFNGVSVGSNSSPAFADLDNDGDFDAFVGAGDGTIRYFRNDEIMQAALTTVLNGTGSITSNPAGILCPGDCSETYTNNTSITLTATPYTTTPPNSGNTVFTGWTVANAPGLCTDLAPCTFTFQTTTTVTANFATGLPRVNWSTAGQNVSENVGQVTVTAGLSLNGQPVTTKNNVTVPFTVAGTATGGDHNLAAGTITLPAGQSQGTISFNITDDTVAEPTDETIVITMGTVSSNSVKGAVTIHTVSLRDNDAGDLNGDNAITLADAILALQVLTGITPPAGIDLSGDINGNGRIDMGDVIFILQRVAGLR